MAEEDEKEGTGATFFSFESMAGPGAWRNRLNLTAEVEAAADAMHFAVNTVGPRKYEEELGAEEEEEKPGTGCFERARLGLEAGGRV